MDIRKQKEENEIKYLSKYATKSADSKGRERKSGGCDIRTVFERDRDRIIHSKAFRRLKHKTQVFISPESDHYRTRLTHTLEVSQIARSVAKAIRANDDLTEAIALGHDLGHTPFGHSGEQVLNEIMADYGGFEHNQQSIRVVTSLENHGRGLNLTYEVIDGIKTHRSSCTPDTLEGKIVRICDKVAYINHDIDDAIRGDILRLEDLPKEYIDILGKTHSERINTMIIDIVENSIDSPDIKMSEEIDRATKGLRQFMFSNVYYGNIAKDEINKAKNVVAKMFEHFTKNKDELPEEYKERVAKHGLERTVCDYIAGMTDRYAINKFQEIFIPKFWS